MAKHKTRITVETHSTTVVRTRSLIAWCSACGEERPWLTVEQAAVITSITQATILSLVHTGRLQSDETLLICLECLQRLTHTDD